MNPTFHIAASVLLAGCFPFDEGPPGASKEQISLILEACHFEFREFEEVSKEDDQLVVSIFENEPNLAAKRACIETESKKLDVIVATVGPLPHIKNDNAQTH